MDATQRVAPISVTLPKNNLNEKDSKFVSEMVRYIGTINGREAIKISIHDTFETRFKISLKKPPKLTLDDIRQIEMMNARIIKIEIDFSRSMFVLEAWKHGIEISGNKRERTDVDEVYEIPDSCSLDNVGEMDIPQVQGVLKMLINATELQFDVDIVKNTRVYNMFVSKVEVLTIKTIDNIVNKFRAFISEVFFDFPQKKIIFVIRKTETPLEKMPSTRRKRVKLE